MSIDSKPREGGHVSTDQNLQEQVRPALAYSPFSKRAYFIGLILCPLIVFWAEYNEVVAQGADLIAMSLIMAVVFALMVLMVINGVLRKFAPGMALSQAELMMIFTINSVLVGFCGF